MKKILIIIILFYALSCSSNKSADTYWNNAKRFRTESKLMESLSNFKDLINYYPDHELAPEAQFQIADIYLNDTKDFEFSIEEFKKVISKYPKHEVAKKSLFMIAYIYNNYLDAYSDAIINYELFLQKYPEDELAASVNYELEGLNKVKNTIKSLIKNQ